MLIDSFNKHSRCLKARFPSRAWVAPVYMGPQIPLSAHERTATLRTPLTELDEARYSAWTDFRQARLLAAGPGLTHS